MNNLSYYCGLIDAKIRASDKDLPVIKKCNVGEFDVVNLKHMLVKPVFISCSEFGGTNSTKLMLHQMKHKVIGINKGLRWFAK